jgi:hypothetical protein
MYKILLTALIISAMFGWCFAACPLDHFEIGINADGIAGTADDNELFVDCSQIYRHSDPAHNEDPTWLYWHYPLYYSLIYHNYYIGEPGFDTIKADDPNHCLFGTPNVDYDIIVEVTSITSGLTAASVDVSPAFTLANAGDSYSHSIYADPHLHMKYRASTNTKLYWITFRMYDAIGKYQPSEPFSVVFVQDPPAGDLAIDGVVDIYDLAEFCHYWLEDNGGKSNDYYERADASKNGKVDFADFAMLAVNWLN